MSNAFWDGGYTAWWWGYRAERRRVTKQLAAAQSDDERRLIKAQLEELERTGKDAKQNADRWLF